MSDAIIKVSNLGKCYRIKHQAERQRYTALRDVLANKVKGWFQNRKSEIGNRKSAEDFWALKDVSFEVKQGEVVGIIGRNGAGKSTLLKILSRITEPTTGRVEIDGRVASLLEVGTGFHPELTGRENIYLNGAILGMHRAEIKRKFDEIVTFAEVEKFLDTPVKRYSSGMYVRLAFAVAAHLEPEILIVDEVLAVGDAQFQKKCLGKMQSVSTKEGRTVLFVSHNMGAISYLCNKGIVLDGGQIVLHGTAQQAVDAYNNTTVKLSATVAGQPAHVLHFAPENARTHDFAITKIEMLDAEGNPKPILHTWDDVVFRLHYNCNKSTARGSIVLDFHTLDGKRLLFLGTEIADMMPLNFRVGTGQADCLIKKLPFAGGDYLVGAGLAIKQVEWLWRGENIARLNVVGHDVYGSGHTLISTDCLIAVAHRWQVV